MSKQLCIVKCPSSRLSNSCLSGKLWWTNHLGSLTSRIVSEESQWKPWQTHRATITQTKYPIQKGLNSIKVTNCYNSWLNQVSPLWHSHIAIWIILVAICSSSSLYKGQGSNFHKSNYLTMGLLIGTYPCVSKLDNDQVQGQPPSLSCHTNHFQQHQITQELTRMLFPDFQVWMYP